MMKKTAFFSLLLAAGSLAACTSSNQQQNTQQDSTAQMGQETMDMEHTSENSLDWQGSYTGTLPCADCPGIKTTVVLNQDMSFRYSAEYLERDTQVADSGKFMWHDNGSVVHLMGSELNQKYKVGENQLIMLDTEGKVNEGDMADLFILKKEN